MSLEFIEPSQAYELANKRLKDTALQERAAEFLGNIWPPGFEDIEVPQAVYAPYLATGSVVEVSFIKTAQIEGFDTVVATYEASEYVTANPAIVDCYRAPLIEARGQCSRKWVVPADKRSGSVGEAQTIYPSLDIVSYWRNVRQPILEENALPVNDKVVDFSEWYQLQAERFGWNGQRSKSGFYYNALMGLYASGRAVLYDTPPTVFAERVMEPAANMAKECLRVEPLITCELKPAKRDWKDVSFLDTDQLQLLKTTGRVQ